MHAHEYGSKHFKHKTNFKDLVVFSDVQQQKIKETAVPSPNIYVEIEKGVKTANKWLLHFNSRLSGEYGDFFLENNSPYGQINKLQYEENDENFAFIQNTIVDFQNGTLPYYKINEKFYIQLDNSIDLEEVIVNATPSPTTRDVKSIQYEAFTTVFISEDGAQLLQAYEAIQNVSAHEVVIFIERSSGSNLFGTVFRIKKGKNVNSLIETNRIRIAEIVRAYGVDVFTNELSKMLEQELKKSTESDFYLVLKKGGQIVRWGADVTLSNLSKFLKSSGEEIGKLQLGESYWKTTDEGKENSKYNPLLPKFNINESFSSEELANSIYKNYVVPVEAPIVTFAERFNKHWLFKELMPFKSERITKLFKHVPGILKEFLDGVKENVQNTYDFINGLLVGLINSIIDFFKSIFDILAILVDVLNGVIQTGKFFEKPGHYLRLLAEGFENLIDLVLNTFTLTNLKAWMQFLIEMPITTAKLLIGLFVKASNTKITIDPGALGYYIGFLVGFIASEVVQFIATGGTANIAKATKAVLKSYQELANVVAKKVVKTAEITVDVVLAAIRKLKEFAKNFAKHLDNLKKWIGEFIEKLVSTANQLFKGFEAVLELLYDLGIVIFEKLDPNTGEVLVSPDGVIYTVKQGDKTILEGTEDAIRKFAKKIDEIRSSGGNSKKKVQSYLDDTWKYFDKVGASQFLYKKTKEMINLYKTGRKVDFEKNVKYLSKSEVDELEIFVQYDKIVDVKGNLIDTNNSISIAEDGFKAITNRAIFVMSDRGEIYLSKLNKYGEFHHSSFLQGGKVSAAGEIVIEKGVIKEITNNSGHYRPLLKDVKENILKELENRDYLFHNGLVGEEKEIVIKFINF
ncbi:hypothetical protein MHM83_02970 [Tenacibaculum sp. Mcav3-52]|uniref:hypothetical protein n=1 Tax=Tenacibaculum sp. Mcav3-52 TaxID=2917762 RepID=UPI001EF22FBC|nr:hypothetical protein [Tenacibaculum sp. Mcav3-52]MCG7500824.1 hypothetical protein [Tenacibaculum sp. Mcav3-52]